MTTTHTIDVEAERVLFEAWAKLEGFRALPRNDPKSPDYYFSYETEQRWVCWLAAKRSIQPTIAAEDVRDAAERTIVIDWPYCNPGCDYEDPHGGQHDGRSVSCACEAAKASIARQRKAIATPTPLSKG